MLNGMSSCQAWSKAAVPQYLYRCIKTYLEDRWVQCREETMKLERGCPQGSVLGPALRNIQYNIIVTGLAKKYPHLCIYADDTLLIIGAPTTAELERKVVECLQYTKQHLAWVGLELNLSKKEIMVRNQFKKSHLLPPPCFKLGSVTLKPRDTITYLGLY